MKQFNKVFLLCLVVAMFAFVSNTLAQHQIQKSVLGSGGKATESTNYKLNGTVGEDAVGTTSTPGGHKIQGGFWYLELQYHIIASVTGPNGGGTISPFGDHVADVGTSHTYIINPNPGYTVSDVLVDGVSQGPLFSYTFTNVQNDHTIQVVFSEIIPTLTEWAAMIMGGLLVIIGIWYIKRIA